MESSPFLSLSSIEEEDKYLICIKTFRRKDKTHCFGVNGWSKFKELAEKWSKLKIHKNNNMYTLRQYLKRKIPLKTVNLYQLFF